MSSDALAGIIAVQVRIGKGMTGSDVVSIICKYTSRKKADGGSEGISNY